MPKNLIPSLKADILIIDDTPDNLRLLNQILSPLYKVRLAPSGATGLSAALSIPPDLILLDVMMPGMNGYEVAAQLKSDEPVAEVPIIFISALDDVESKVRGFAAGGVDYITKPFQEKEVLARVHTHLSLRALYKQLQAELAERKKSEEQLRQLSRAVEASQASIVITDTNAQIEYINPAFTKLTGYTLEEARGKNPRILQSKETPPGTFKNLWETLTVGNVWRGEFCNKNKNGDLYWEIASIAPITNTEGVTTHYVAVKENITERKQAETALRENRKFLADLIEYSGAIIFVKDIHGRYELVNRKYEEVMGIPREVIIGHTDTELFSDSITAQYRKSDLSVIESGQIQETEEFFNSHQGQRYLITIKFPLHAADGSIRGICGMTTDITDRKQTEDALRKANKQLESQLREIEALQASLREQAIRDPLTRLYNRRFLNETIEHEFHLAERQSQPLSIIFLDIDHFKSINDTHGHAAGDAYLIMLSNLLQQYVRKSDIVCRYGGEEFLLVLPDTNLNAAAQHAEKLRLLFSNALQIFEGQEIQATISLGIATYPIHGNKYTEVIEKADQAMYASKNSGRNRVTVWAEDIKDVK